MNNISIPDKRKKYIGAAVGVNEIEIGFLTTYGNFIDISSTSYVSNDTIGKSIANVITGLRGCLNFRTKNFAGIGIYVQDPSIDKYAIEQELKKHFSMPVAFGNYSYVYALGDEWIKKVGDNTGFKNIKSAEKMKVLYGAVKLVKQNTYVFTSKDF